MACLENFHLHEIRILILVTLSHMSTCSFKMLSIDQNYIVDTGAEISLYCEFNKMDFDLFNNPFQWRKSQYGESSEMNIMGNIKAPYESTGRFTVTFLETPPSYTSILTIKNISRVDSGNYSCDVKGPKSAELGSVHYTVYTKAPVTDLSIVQANSSYSTRSTVTPLLFFTERAPTSLRCVSKGGSPPPVIEITIGRENYTKHFRFDSMYSVSGEVGFRTLQITTMMVTDDFQVTAADDGKTLKCKAKVPGLKEVVKSADISVNYAPQIKCTSPSAYLGTTNVPLNCTVIAHPPVTSWYWELDENGNRISEGDVFPEHWTLRIEHRKRNALELVLYVKLTTEDSFRNYTVVVRNRVATIKTVVSLDRKYRASELWDTDNQKKPSYKNRHSGRASRDPSSLYANGSSPISRNSCVLPSFILSVLSLTCLRLRP